MTPIRCFGAQGTFGFSPSGLCMTIFHGVMAVQSQNIQKPESMMSTQGWPALDNGQCKQESLPGHFHTAGNRPLTYETQFTPLWPRMQLAQEGTCLVRALEHPGHLPAEMPPQAGPLRRLDTSPASLPSPHR